MAGGDAFFEEGIHWLHVAGSLGPRITRAHGYRPTVSRSGPDRRAKSLLVAFEYDSGAVGTLSYSREIPSLLRGLRLSKLFGRDGVITFESNGGFVVARRRGRFPRLILPGIRDIRGYQAMYRDFVASIRTGRPPEMRLERAIEDQQLMDQIMVTARETGGDRRRQIPRDADVRFRPRDHRFRRGRRHDGARPGLDAASHPPDRARRRGPVGAGELEPGRGLEGSAIPHRRALGRRRRPRVPAVYALQRRRQHQVLGQRAVPPAPRGLRRDRSTATASRPRGRLRTTISRRGTTSPSACTTCTARAAPIPPSRRAGRIRIRLCRMPRPCNR